MEYRLDNKKVRISNFNLIGYGRNGNVYKCRKDAIKVFSNKNLSDEIIDEETCKRLRDISTECILLPKKILYYNDKFSGYSLKYLNNKSSINKIYNEDKEILIGNITSLENDIKLLSKRGVLLSGLTMNNTLVDDKIYITDPSSYAFLDDYNGKGLEKINDYQLYLLINSLVLMSIKRSDVENKSNLKELRYLLQSKSNSMSTSGFYDKLLKNNSSVRSFVKKMYS